MNPVPEMLDSPLPYRLRRVIALTCVVLWFLALVATHTPPSHMPSLGNDKLLHLMGYFGLASAFWLTVWAYRVSRPWRMVLVLLILLVNGALDELTQPAFGRTADVADWLFDSLGVACSLLVCEISYAVFRRGNRNS